MPFSGFDPPFEDLLRVFRKTKAEVDPFEVVITGGEPFVRKDAIQVLEEAVRIFGEIGVTTNGTRLSSLSTIDLATLRGISGRKGGLHVSIDSTDPKINDSIRGGTGSLLRGLDTLEAARVAFSAGIVVTTINLPSLPATLDHLIHRYKCMRGISFLNLMPSEVLGLSWSQLVVRPSEYRSLCDAAAIAARRAGRPDIEIRTDRENENVESVLDGYRIPFCLAGLTKLEVLPNGDVTPCSMIRSVTLGNLYRESWNDIWTRSIGRLKGLEEIGATGAQCVYLNCRDLVQIASPGSLAQ
jgi:MoaA/NifB/PqqE/SkfB family radical SAM enzyme